MLPSEQLNFKQKCKIARCKTKKRSHAGALPTRGKRKNQAALKQRATWQVKRKPKDSSHSLNSNKKRDATEVNLRILQTPRLDVWLPALQSGAANSVQTMMAVAWCLLPSAKRPQSAIIHEPVTVTEMQTLSAALQKLWRSVNNNSACQPRLPPKAKEGKNSYGCKYKVKRKFNKQKQLIIT